MLTIVGLGRCAEDLPQGAKEALQSGARIILRTGETASAESVIRLGVPFETLDGIYESSRNFGTLGKNLASAVLKAAKEGDTVYCVDGSASDDVSVRILAEKRPDARILAGVSKAESAFCAARVFSAGRSSCSAYDMKGKLFAPAAVTDVDDVLVAGDAKLKLCGLFGDEAEAYFVRGGKAEKIRMYEIDRQGSYDSSCCVVVDEIPLLERTRFDYADLLEILRLLRAPDGCPWDRVQTHESIRINMIEEAYELVDAIDCRDDAKICEEAGDVLMQGAFHTILGAERGAFEEGDVLSEVCRKLIFRHSHIFGKDKASDEQSALSVWEKNKKKEKGQETFGDSVRDVPAAFPALLRAQKVLKRASKCGHPPVPAVMPDDQDAGGLLLYTADVCRLLGVDAEECLRERTKAFADVFCLTEELAAADGKRLDEISGEEYERYRAEAERSYAGKAD